MMPRRAGATPKGTRSKVIEMAKLGTPRGQIADACDLSVGQVYEIVSHARKCGQEIPRPRRWTISKSKPRVPVHREVLDRLRPHAAVRDMEVRELAEQLLDVVGREDIVAAVLDDRDANE